MQRMLKSLDSSVYWLIVLLPFSMAISPAPMNVFMGLLIASFSLKKALKREPFFIKTAINSPLLLLFTITSVSIFYSANFGDTIKGGILRLLQYIFIFFIIAVELRDKKHLWRVILSAASGLCLVSVDGIWQVFSGKDFIRGYSPIVNIGLVRASASFKDSNTLGIYLSAIAPLVFGLTLYYLKGIKKAIFSIISLVVLIGICLTYSRPTLLAVYLAVLLLVLVKRSRALLGLMLVFTLIMPFLTPKSVRDFARQVNYNPIRFMCNDDRIAIFRNSLNMIKHHPLIGVGANTFMKNYKKYKESPEYLNVVTSDTLYAHNNFLHIAGELGLTGLSIFIWLLYKLFRESALIYARLDGRFFKAASLSLSACLLAFLINGLTESSMYYSRVAMIFWYLMGLSLALKKFINADKSRLIKNILVVRNDRFGEFLLNTPAMRALKETFSGAKLIAVVNPYVSELAGAAPFIDEVIEWADKTHSFPQRLKLLGLLKRKNIDMAVMLNPSKEFNILTFLAGIPIRAGYDRKCPFFLTLKMKDEKYLGKKHEVEYNLDLVRLVGANTPDLSLSLKIDGSMIKGLSDNYALMPGSFFVAIHPWTSDPVKQWPLENFKGLAKQILGNTGLKVIIVGGKEELSKSRELFAGLGVIDLTGKTSLLQLGTVLKMCKLLISSDSGPVHLASALGIPVLALFRNDLPGKAAKRWGPWGEGNSVIEKSNLPDITVDEVFQNAKEMINK